MGGLEGGIAWVCMLVTACWLVCGAIDVVFGALAGIPARAWAALVCAGLTYLERHAFTTWTHEDFIGLSQLLSIPAVLLGVPAAIALWWNWREKMMAQAIKPGSTYQGKRGGWAFVERITEDSVPQVFYRDQSGQGNCRAYSFSKWADMASKTEGQPRLVKRASGVSGQPHHG